MAIPFTVARAIGESPVSRVAWAAYAAQATRETGSNAKVGLGGRSLAARRETDCRADTSSSPWFLYGGSNSVGSQALVGIPRVRELRQTIAGARIWPFETGARLPARVEAPVLLAEIYPSLFYVRDSASDHVHDKLQVEATACRFAALDAGNRLAGLFAAPAADASAVHEEGWVLGAA